MRYISAEPNVCIVSSNQADTLEDFKQNRLLNIFSDSLQSNINACIFYDTFKLNSTLSDSFHFCIHLNISSFQFNFNNLYDLLLQLFHPFSIIFISEARINVEPLANINLPCFAFSSFPFPTPSVVGRVGAYFFN